MTNKRKLKRQRGGQLNPTYVSGNTLDYGQRDANTPVVINGKFTQVQGALDSLRKIIGAVF